MGSGHAIPLLRRCALVGASACALFLALAGPGAAAAPCYQRLTLDWAADGSVDDRYPIACYTEAIEHLPTAERLYSSAEDDIQRALQRAIADQNGGGGPVVAPDKPNSSGDDGVPLPFVALGGVAILLLALGGGGFLRKRFRGDRPSTP
jgi:hypothetical protein